ncbi:hypothetical protein NP233_g11411 [Leucocoprinus birnbaumii]|uniref:DUF6532 domain-containing protein n=1 Tax=Leucocoprinus birnbaumii TaxID=56174 RepID=A0AAD5YLB3_9AGAR|nr:hypothetical protein NP233_g11411 [Leucocoprinus birnbaumii]
MVKFNRDLAKFLCSKLRFTYQDTIKKTGIYQNKIISNTLNAVVFKHKKDGGIIHEDLFRDANVRPIALILTAVECALDEWNTGKHEKIMFMATEYELKYKNHVADLKDLNEESSHARVQTDLEDQQAEACLSKTEKKAILEDLENVTSGESDGGYSDDNEAPIRPSQQGGDLESDTEKSGNGDGAGKVHSDGEVDKD